ncbi:hypothetical protein FCR2A7T_11600 [Flavobacterium cauense R2A-7]|nr:hypothetical protein FCR2A7T_11600 [Flavobacterium cauense R2A-7]
MVIALMFKVLSFVDVCDFVKNCKKITNVFLSAKLKEEWNGFWSLRFY